MCDNRFTVDLKVTCSFYDWASFTETYAYLLKSMQDIEHVVDVERGEVTFQKGVYVPATKEEFAQ